MEEEKETMPNEDNEQDEEEEEEEEEEEDNSITEPIIHDDSTEIDTEFFSRFKTHEITHFLLYSGVLSNASFVTCLQKQNILKQSKVRMYDEQKKQAQEKLAFYFIEQRRRQEQDRADVMIDTGIDLDDDQEDKTTTMSSSKHSKDAVKPIDYITDENRQLSNQSKQKHSKTNVSPFTIKLIEDSFAFVQVHRYDKVVDILTEIVRVFENSPTYDKRYMYGITLTNDDYTHVKKLMNSLGRYRMRHILNLLSTNRLETSTMEIVQKQFERTDFICVQYKDIRKQLTNFTHLRFLLRNEDYVENVKKTFQHKDADIFDDKQKLELTIFNLETKKKHANTVLKRLLQRKVSLPLQQRTTFFFNFQCHQPYKTRNSTNSMDLKYSAHPAAFCCTIDPHSSSIQDLYYIDCFRLHDTVSHFENNNGFIIDFLHAFVQVVTSVSSSRPLKALSNTRFKDVYLPVSLNDSGVIINQAIDMLQTATPLTNSANDIVQYRIQQTDVLLQNTSIPKSDNVLYPLNIVDWNQKQYDDLNTRLQERYDDLSKQIQDETDESRRDSLFDKQAQILRKQNELQYQYVLKQLKHKSISSRKRSSLLRKKAELENELDVSVDSTTDFRFLQTQIAKATSSQRPLLLAQRDDLLDEALYRQTMRQQYSDSFKKHKDIVLEYLDHFHSSDNFEDIVYKAEQILDTMLRLDNKYKENVLHSIINVMKMMRMSTRTRQRVNDLYERRLL